MATRTNSDSAQSSGNAFRSITRVLRDRYGRDRQPEAAREGIPKVVVVVGGGASAWGGMPLWDETLKEQIVKEVEECFGDFVWEAWRKLGPTIGLLDRQAATDLGLARKKLLRLAPIDALCSVACEYEVVGDRLRSFLRETYMRTYASRDAGAPPQLAYELLAHFMKHGFIDDVVTFTFDELIDAAISNELGQDEYDLIVTDHQVIPVGPPQKPRLIKVHGTISSPQTLRFAQSDTGLLTGSMIRLLDETFFSSRSSGGHEEKRKAHILTLGYSWEDRDFAEWVYSRRERIHGITVVRRKCELPPLLSRRFSAQSRDNPSVQVLSTKCLAESTRRPISIDHLLWAVWELLFSQLEGKHAIMPASRHLILGYLFGPKMEARKSSVPSGVAEDFLNTHNAHNRFWSEVLLHIAKSKGMVNASVMANDDRIQRLRIAAAESTEHDGDLMGTHNLLVQSADADVKETYFSTAHTRTDLAAQFIDIFNTGPIWEPTFEEGADGGRIHLNRVSEVEFFRKHIEHIFDAPEVEIVRDGDPSCEWLFDRAIHIPTYSSFQSVSRNLLREQWTHLFSIAETGAWLTSKIMRAALTKKNDATIMMLQASDDALQQWHLRKEIAAHLERERTALTNGRHCVFIDGELVWWQHNRHLTLSYDASTGKFGSGIYFRRRLKSSRVSPVLVEEQRDCAEVFLTFMSYVRRACAERPGRAAEGGNGVDELRKLVRVAQLV